MARLDEIPQPIRSAIASLPCLPSSDNPFNAGPPLKQRTVALVSTAGLHSSEDKPFSIGSADFRRIPSGLPEKEIRMSHLSVNFDRTGFYRDLNVVWPVEPLAKMKENGQIGGIGANHFSFMGAADPERLKHFAREAALELKSEGVNAALLIPV